MCCPGMLRCAFRDRRQEHRVALSVLAAVFCFGIFQGLLGCGSGKSANGGSTQVSNVSVLTAALAGGTEGITYNSVLLASGGTGTGYVWTVSNGSLPAGIVLSAGGVLSGTPTAMGSAAFTVKVIDSGGNTATAALSIAVGAAGPLSTYELTGDVSPAHDPSIIRQGSRYYVFVTDAGGQTSYIPIRCSADKIAWTACGYVFNTMPAWVASTAPAATNIWAPDISYFNGAYHLYYAVSTLGSQASAIGLVTTPTLDAADPAYKWTDQGVILKSSVGANFNAIDPNILVDTDGSVWLTYGSYWDGIFQQQVNPATGQLMPGTPAHLAERAASVVGDPVEGASLVHKGSYYYLFVSWDACCNASPSTDNYKIAMGRSASRQGPFVDESGVDMAAGGGTILLQGDGVNWSAPGGETAYLDATGGDLLVFHALSVYQNYLDCLFVRTLTWTNGWPVIGNSTVTAGATATSASPTLDAVTSARLAVPDTLRARTPVGGSVGTAALQAGVLPLRILTRGVTHSGME